MPSARKFWLDTMLKIADPVLNALEKGELKATLPSYYHPDRFAFAPLEAFGRTMTGLTAWLEADENKLDEEEKQLQAKYREKVINCLDMCSDPASPDFMLFDEGGQPLVDAAFLAHALVRAPKQIAAKLPEKVRVNLANAFRSSRKIPAFNSNWIFFSAMVEAGLYVLGEEYDMLRVLYPIRSFMEWYKGDGMYGDGTAFHFDYYNSFVIQPMYVDLCRLLASANWEIEAAKDKVITRAARYASILERMIGPEGSYPVVGRSICYRFGCFHMLAQASLEHMLEENVAPAAVRCGLTAVIKRVTASPDMFDQNGWLQPGVIGLQPELGETYINIGSLYLCCSVFLPLGLTPDDPFWADADASWSGKKVWDGDHITIDHAIMN